MSYPSPRPKAWPSRFPPPRRRAAAGGGLHAPLTAARPHLSNGRTARLFAASVRTMARPRPRPPPLPSLASCPLAFSSSLRASPGIPRACIPAARRGRVMRAPARGQSATTRHAKCPGRPACRRRKRRRRRSATCQMSGAAGHACRQDRGPLRRARAWQGMRAALHALPWFASCSRGSAARTGGRVGPALCTLRQAGAGWRRVWEGRGKRGDAGCGTGRRVREKMKRV